MVDGQRESPRSLFFVTSMAFPTLKTTQGQSGFSFRTSLICLLLLCSRTSLDRSVRKRNPNDTGNAPSPGSCDDRLDARHRPRRRFRRLRRRRRRHCQDSQEKDGSEAWILLDVDRLVLV